MTTATAAPRTVLRFEIRPAPGIGDPRADRLRRDADAIGIPITGAATTRVYLIETDAADPDRIAGALLASPVAERATTGAAPAGAGAAHVEVHPLPGVMDPAAASVAAALREVLGIEAAVSTGWRYDLEGVSPEQAHAIAHRLLANTVVSRIHAGAFHPAELPKGAPADFAPRSITIRGLTDDQLVTLSRTGHLFLDLHEMHAIQAHYETLGREPTDIELETLAQTWSEHCVHKTLKSTVRYEHDGLDNDPIDWSNRPGHVINDDGSITINNLLKSTVAAATFELIEEGLDWTLSVFVDNAGIIAFDDDNAVCVKVETHNHPSALEPYGGAATGIGGCIRDIIGTGLAAKPIASTDVFCVAMPDATDIPEGCLHPKRILTEITAGVRDYGNRMGIPTVNGAVYFDDRYVGNPLVYCGCIGVMPRGQDDSLLAGDPKQGDRIVALGGRTGRDGIHGATFSSAELTDDHADEFGHAVQIGNAIEEKRVLDAILRARDTDNGPLFTAITDCGAGGFSSAVGEMGEKIGAHVHLDRAPLKYDGLTYDEIWIAEAQERMVLSVPESNLADLQRICDEEHVELAVLGTFGTDNAELILDYLGNEVGRLPMAFLHDGIPTPTRTAKWSKQSSPVADGGGGARSGSAGAQPGFRDRLLESLAHPNTASKHWIIRQYDHEVQGNTLIKPLGGPEGIGPMDAAVIEPVPGSSKGLAIACGLATDIGDPEQGGDPYLMALAAIDECVRNLVCAGADPERIAILDNFCWPSCGKPENLASLVRAAEGCYDAAKAYRTPFISGKDSLNNQFTTKSGRTIEIPPTLLITGVGIVHDTAKCTTTDAKKAGNEILLISAGTDHADLTKGPQTASLIAEIIREDLAVSIHDSSEGGPIVALAEMLIGGHTQSSPIGAALHTTNNLFAERPSTYLVEASTEQVSRIESIASGRAEVARFATLDHSGLLSAGSESVSLDELTAAWRGTLDW